MFLVVLKEGMIDPLGNTLARPREGKLSMRCLYELNLRCLYELFIRIQLFS